MPTRHCTPARERILTYWNRTTGEAIATRDRGQLRSLKATIGASVEALDGADKARALALLARVEAGIRWARRFGHG